MRHGARSRIRCPDGLGGLGYELRVVPLFGTFVIVIVLRGQAYSRRGKRLSHYINRDADESTTTKDQFTLRFWADEGLPTSALPGFPEIPDDDLHMQHKAGEVRIEGEDRRPA